MLNYKLKATNDKGQTLEYESDSLREVLKTFDRLHTRKPYRIHVDKYKHCNFVTRIIIKATTNTTYDI